MGKHRKTKEVLIRSTLRLPKGLHEILNRVADRKRLSQQQTTERAIAEYCFYYGNEVDREWISEHFEVTELFQKGAPFFGETLTREKPKGKQPRGGTNSKRRKRYAEQRTERSDGSIS